MVTLCDDSGIEGCLHLDREQRASQYSININYLGFLINSVTVRLSSFCVLSSMLHVTCYIVETFSTVGPIIFVSVKKYNAVGNNL